MEIEVRSPFPAYAWPLVWEWMQTFRARVNDDFGPQTREAFVEQMLAADPAHTWGVWRDGELGGLLYVPRLSPILAFSHMVFKRSFWGRDTTLAATRQVFDAVFRSGVEKIASAAFVDNHAVRSLGPALGAVEEGLKRQHTRRNGQPIDMIDFGILREDFYAAWTGADIGDDRGQHGRRGTQQSLENDNGHAHEHPDVHPGAIGVAGEPAGSVQAKPHQRAESPADEDGRDGDD